MKPKLKILFIEDREDDMLLVLRALARGGYTVQQHRVQDEAGERKMLIEQNWDMVIADYSMPGFSGAEALRIFKEYKLEIPFILVSGSVGEDIAVQMMKDGANDYVMKDKLARIVPAIDRELLEFEGRRKKKQMEDELYRARLIIDSTDVILWQWKPVAGSPVLYVSQNVKQFGYTPEEFISGHIPFLEFLHPDDREAVKHNSRENIQAKHDLYKQHYRVICKNGTIRWLDDYTTIVRDENQNATLIQGITYDVTDNILLGKDLDRSQNLYRSLVDTSPDGICMINMDYITTFVNKRKAELFGYDSTEEMIGMHALQTLAPEYHGYILEQEKELLAFGRVSIPEVAFIRKDG
ncbi:MAG: PAS domain-containing protein, partial [Candidatus Cloacimonadaceae bacterium]|nr:PAS domain-containing protein [Candidatus Cloacimonadaceae bacterium]